MSYTQDRKRQKMAVNEVDKKQRLMSFLRMNTDEDSSAALQMDGVMHLGN